MARGFKTGGYKEFSGLNRGGYEWRGGKTQRCRRE